MKKTIFAALLLALVFLTSAICNANAREVAFQASVEKLVKNPEAFNGRKVTLQGFVVGQQVFAKPTQYYLRDESDNMIKLEFSKNIDLSKYNKIEVSGGFKVENEEMQLTVDEVTPLEKAPEAQFVTGSQNTIVIMAYFTDKVNTKNQGDVHKMIFSDMNDYYIEVSYSWVYVTGVGNTNGWYPWVNIGQTVAYYGADSGTIIDPHGWWFIRDAVAKVDAAVNFGGYSRFIFVCAGPNQETSGVSTDLWSARWFNLNIPTNDGVTITHGMIVPDIEKSPYGVLGVHAHEYGHELGLPDLYTYPSNIKQYDLMDSGSWNNYGNTPSGFTSWCKMQQGWIMGGQIYTLPWYAGEYLRLDPLEDPTASISVIKVPYGNDYFLIEGRRKVGYDAYIPYERVLVLFYNYAEGKVYLKASLTYGGQYEYGSFGVMVTGTDMEGWSYTVYAWLKSWSGIKRLTNAAGDSRINLGHLAVATTGMYVYTTWFDTRDGNWETYFKRSMDWGFSWEADQRLTNNGSSQIYPSIAAHGTYVYVAWQDDRHGNWEIYFKRNWNSGASNAWYADQRLTTNTAVSYRPSVAVSGRNVYVVWVDGRNGNWEIYFRRSTDNGLTWGSTTRLTNNTAASSFPNVAAVGSNVYVAWTDNRNGNWDIFFKRSTNYGVTWNLNVDTALTTNTANQVDPSIAAWGTDVHVLWTDNRYGTSNTEIFERRSLNSGASWMSERKLTSSSYLDECPVVAVIGKSVYLVWQSNRTGTWEVYFKESPNRGVYWTLDRRLSSTPYDSLWPSIAVGGADWADVYIAWTDFQYGTGNPEIYFKYRY